MTDGNRSAIARSTRIIVQFGLAAALLGGPSAWAKLPAARPVAAAGASAPAALQRDGIWAPLPKASVPSHDNLASQVPPARVHPVSAALRNELADIYSRFAFAADITCSLDGKMAEFTRNATFFSPSYGSDAVGQTAIRAGLKALADGRGGEQACRDRWINEPQTRQDHLWLMPVFDQLAPNYVRTYAKAVIVGPDTKDATKYGVRSLRIYVIDFAREQGVWKMHLYFID